MYTVYLHENRINNKKYVGITCQIPWLKRAGLNGNGYRTCNRFWNAIQKYGWENFDHTVLATCDSQSEAMELEKHYIAEHKTTDDQYGYNIKTGGEHQIYPQEIRDHISQSRKGKSSRGSGWTVSDATRKKMSEAQKGRKMTPEHRQNCMNAMCEYFKTHAPAHTFTEEDHLRSKEACSVKVRIVETGEVFDAMTDCANHLGVLISNLSRAIKEGRKYKGYHYEKVCS